MRLRNLRRTPVWEEAFLQTLLKWLENDSWSSRVTPKRVISGFWSITMSLITMCKSLWQFLGPRLYTWYTTQRCCFLPQLKCFPPRWLSSPLKTVGGHQRTWITYFNPVERCRSFWKTFQGKDQEADPRGQPHVVAHPSLVVSWLILTLFFLFVKYDPIRVSKLLEKPHALSLLIRGESTANRMPLTCQWTRLRQRSSYQQPVSIFLPTQ